MHHTQYIQTRIKKWRRQLYGSWGVCLKTWNRRQKITIPDIRCFINFDVVRFFLFVQVVRVLPLTNLRPVQETSSRQVYSHELYLQSTFLLFAYSWDCYYVQPTKTSAPWRQHDMAWSSSTLEPWLSQRQPILQHIIERIDSANQYQWNKYRHSNG